MVLQDFQSMKSKQISCNLGQSFSLMFFWAQIETCFTDVLKPPQAFSILSAVEGTASLPYKHTSPSTNWVLISILDEVLEDWQWPDRGEGSQKTNISKRI